MTDDDPSLVYSDHLKYFQMFKKTSRFPGSSEQIDCFLFVRQMSYYSLIDCTSGRVVVIDLVMHFLRSGWRIPDSPCYITDQSGAFEGESTVEGKKISETDNMLSLAV